MPIVEEKKDEQPKAEEEQQSHQAEVRPQTDAEAEAEAAKLAEAEEEHVPEPVGVASPSQLGTRRFVYAAYFAGAIAIAFLLSKLLGFAWYRLQTWKPQLGEPRDEIIMPVSALIGVAAAIYFWFRTRARELAEQVANEMSKVTWPTRTEVTNGTFVVIVTTIISTVFFALMDRFWGFVTNLVYGGT